MQVLLDKNELRKMRWKWFKGGAAFMLFIILLLIGTVFYFVNSAGQSQVSTVGNTKLNTSVGQAYPYTTPQAERDNRIQNKPVIEAEGWGRFFVILFVISLTVSMIVVVVNLIRAKARKREMAHKPEGFWNWESNQQK